MAFLISGKFITVFLVSTIYIGKGGIWGAISFNFSFTETLIAVGGGGIFGSFLFTYLFDGLIHAVNRFLDKKFPDRKKNKKKFTKWNRFIINAKRYFGVKGIAFLSPLILSIPLGTFLALKFFGGKKKIFLWFSVFSVFWTIVLHFVFGRF